MYFDQYQIQKIYLQLQKDLKQLQMNLEQCEEQLNLFVKNLKNGYEIDGQNYNFFLQLKQTLLKTIEKTKQILIQMEKEMRK